MSDIGVQQRKRRASGVSSLDALEPKRTAIMTVPNEKPDVEARPTSVTLRISCIPKTLSSGDLLGELKSLKNADNIQKHSFAPSTCGKFSVATVTFRDIPTIFEKTAQTEWRLKGHTVYVDREFLGLTPLSNPEHTTVDIIAVTGLAGHAYGSWKSREICETPPMWLRDFLPGAVRSARILIYGYDTKLVQSKSNALLLEFSKTFLESVRIARNSNEEKTRPLIFIGHSLGGLVIKKALVEAAQADMEDKYQAIFRSCYGILFFGVPSTGLETSSLKTMVKGQMNEKLIEELGKFSSILYELSNSFSRLFTFEDSRILFFYETKTTRTVQSSPTGVWERTGPEMMMVERDSAIHNWKYGRPEDQHPINEDHSEIVKFSRNSQNYEIVEDFIKDLVDNAPVAIEKRFQPQKDELSEAQKKCRGALRLANAPSYSNFREKRVAKSVTGTLEWILEEEAVVSWHSQMESVILWVKGSPGQGKTVLSRFLLDRLENDGRFGAERLSCRKVKVIYFFCNNQDPRLRTTSSILRSLIEQLLTDTPASLFRHILPLFEKNPEHFAPSYDTLWDIFKDIISDPVLSTVYCVIDALDECEEGKSPDPVTTFLRHIKDLVSNRKTTSRPHLKLLFTSRNIIRISDELEDAQLCINLQARFEDIKAFIHEKVSELPKNRFHQTLRDELEKVLLLKAERTFLWVSIALKIVEKMVGPTSACVKQTISECPTDLRTLYQKILGSLLEVGKKILTWVAYAFQPLTLKALDSAVALQMDSKSLESSNEHSLHLNAISVIGIGGSLIEVTSENTVSFIHQSVKDFLLLKRFTFCSGLDPNIYLANVCMTYLNLEDFARQIRPTDDPFYEYASAHWYKHIVNEQDVEHVLGKLPSLVTPGTQTVSNWTAHKIYPYPIDHPLQLALGIDCFWLTAYILSDKNKNISKEFSTNHLEIILARSKGPIAKLLLARRPDIQITRRVVWSALYGESGLEVMELLLDRKLDILITEEVLKLVAGCKYYSCEMMELLLDRKPDIQITEAVLKAAVVDCDMMELLLDRKPDIQITEDVLKLVAGREYYSCEGLGLGLLLDRNSDIRVQITKKVLKVAAGRNYGTMKLLLDRKPDIQITEEVLKLVAGRSWEMMKLLLDRKPDIRIQITEEVLKAAAGNYYDGTGVMELLLECDPDIQITHEVVKAALGNQRCGPGVIKLLQDRNPNIIIPFPE